MSTSEDKTGTANVDNPTNGRRFTLDPHMTYGQMRHALSLQPRMPYVLTVPGDALSEHGMTCGVYDELLQTITLNDDMTYTQKRCTLVHELFHWLHGHEGCDGVIGRRGENLVRRETAMFLIDPVRCVMAERSYDAEPFLMAGDLDVTVQVLEDYRRILHDTNSPVSLRR